MKTSKEYIDLLNSNDNKFIALTYETFFELLNKYCPNDENNYWINYLTERYIVTNKNIITYSVNDKYES